MPETLEPKTLIEQAQAGDVDTTLLTRVAQGFRARRYALVERLLGASMKLSAEDQQPLHEDGLRRFCDGPEEPLDPPEDAPDAPQGTARSSTGS